MQLPSFGKFNYSLLFLTLVFFAIGFISRGEGKAALPIGIFTWPISLLLLGSFGLRLIFKKSLTLIFILFLIIYFGIGIFWGIVVGVDNLSSFWATVLLWPAGLILLYL